MSAAGIESRMVLFFLAALIGDMQHVADAGDHLKSQKIESHANADSSQAVGAEIVVRGEKGGGLDAGNRSRKVIVGSRIPRASVQSNPHIASATSLGGLTPGSGMDAFENETAVRWKSCNVDGFSVSSDVGCTLRKARKVMDAQQWQDARAILMGLMTRPDLSLEEQYLAHRLSYEIAASRADRDGRRRSLAGMVDTGLMTAGEEPAALRTLAAMAIKAGDAEDAIARYREVTLVDANDQSRINLAVLLQQRSDDAGAKAQFLGAVAIMQRNGMLVPENLVQASR